MLPERGKERENQYVGGIWFHEPGDRTANTRLRPGAARAAGRRGGGGWRGSASPRHHLVCVVYYVLRK